MHYIKNDIVNCNIKNYFTYNMGGNETQFLAWYILYLYIGIRYAEQLLLI
jgi:hypothetical protein